MTHGAITHALDPCSEPSWVLFARLGLLLSSPLTARTVAALATPPEPRRPAPPCASTVSSPTHKALRASTSSRPVPCPPARARAPERSADKTRNRAGLLEYHLVVSSDAARALHPGRRQLETAGRGPRVPAARFADTDEALLWFLAELPAVIADVRHCAGRRDGWRCGGSGGLPVVLVAAGRRRCRGGCSPPRACWSVGTTPRCRCVCCGWPRSTTVCTVARSRRRVRSTTGPALTRCWDKARGKLSPTRPQPSPECEAQPAPNTPTQSWQTWPRAATRRTTGRAT